MNLTVYLPDRLAEQVRGSDMNVSAICQEALRVELGKRAPQRSAESIAADTDIDHELAVAILKDFHGALKDIIGMILDGGHVDVEKIFEAARETCRRRWRIPAVFKESGVSLSVDSALTEGGDDD